MNQGHYLDDILDAAPTSFCTGVSCYPEKHFEAPNLEFDIEILKRKQDAGAHYAVSQMFFNTQKFLDFVALARSKGVTIPIIPGLKILTSQRQLTSIPRVFFVDLPNELCGQMLKADTKEKQVKVGINWALKQSLELMEAGFPLVHFYIMQNTKPFVTLMDQLWKKV